MPSEQEQNTTYGNYTWAELEGCLGWTDGQTQPTNDNRSSETPLHGSTDLWINWWEAKVS